MACSYKRYLCVPALLGSTLGMAQRATLPQGIVIIYADDLGYGDVSSYGASRVHTPHIDRLAKGGIRFTQAYASAATSTPSRYSLLTGEYAWRKPGTNVAPGDASMIIAPETYTLADLMKQAGYHTAAIGKWHLGLGAQRGKQDWNGTIEQGPADLGFDYSFIMPATGDRVPCVFLENQRVVNHDSSAPIEVSYSKPFPGEPLGHQNPELLTKLRSSFEHDQAIVNGIGRIGYMRGGGRALWQDENLADSLTTHAVSFIEQSARQGQPFFLYLATNDIHVPRYPHNRFRGKSSMGLRGDAILQLDWTVGQVLAKLDSLALTDKTLIVFTSDNGPVLDDGYVDEAFEKLGDHSPTGGLRGGKYSTLEGGTRIPFLVHWPQAIKGGQESQALISQVSLMSIMKQLLASKLPKSARRRGGIDSEPILRTLLGRDAKGSKYVVEQASNSTLSIRNREGWKYIPSSDGPATLKWAPGIETGYSKTPQLYYLPNDAKEQHNLISEHPEIAKKLRLALEKIVARGKN